MKSLRELEDLRRNNPEYAGWHIHHIDWNHKNNDRSNLILIPEVVHQHVHKFSSVNDRAEVERMVKIYLLTARYSQKEIAKMRETDPNFSSIPKKDWLLMLKEKCASYKQQDDVVFGQLSMDL